MGLLGNLLSGLGLVLDAGENIRNTTTDILDNKPNERKYDFDDGTGYGPEDYLKARKESKKARKKEKKISQGREER